MFLCKLEVHCSNEKRIRVISYDSGLAVALLVLLSVSNTIACTMTIGYFYQVTALKGRVVGTTFTLRAG